MQGIRFLNEAVRTAGKNLVNPRIMTKPGRQQNLDRRVEIFERGIGFFTGHHRHHQIEQHQCNGAVLFLKQSHTGSAVIGQKNLIAAFRQEIAGSTTHQLFIINNQNRAFTPDDDLLDLLLGS